jgi:hypothetical protein
MFGFMLLAVVSFACSYMLEIYTHQPWRMPFGQQLFNSAFYLLLLLFWLGVTGRGLGAAIATCAMSLLIGYANFSVVTFRNNPILPWDLLSMQTALSVSANYQLPVPRNWWYILLLATLVIVLAVRTKVRLTRAKPRLLLALCSLILLFSYAGILQSHRFTSFFCFNETLFTPDYLYMQNGFVPSFLMNLRYLRVEEPEGYSIDEVEELATGISAMASEDVIPDAGSISDKPNLIVIMNETFSDPSVLSSYDARGLHAVFPFPEGKRDLRRPLCLSHRRQHGHNRIRVSDRRFHGISANRQCCLPAVYSHRSPQSAVSLERVGLPDDRHAPVWRRWLGPERGI